MAAVSGIWSIFDKTEAQIAKKVAEYRLKKLQNK